MPEMKSDNTVIEAWRGLAAWLVLYTHYWAFGDEASALWRFSHTGVDLFFVISGFLITRIIATDHGKGQFRLTNFYGRRIRRIFPALILVLLACLIMGWQVLLAHEYAQLGLHLVAGAGFLSNLALWRESGYFDTASELKPLLHLWSLGIEEQFYIAWPCVLWLAYRMTSSLLRLTGLMFLISWGWNAFTVGNDPVGAFYLPYSRAWELLVGAGLALMIQVPGVVAVRWAQHYRNPIAALGLLLIGLSMVALSKDSLFPGAWALMPTLGAAMLIAASGAWVNRHVLSARGLVAVGLISYPLYLWHWPLLSFARIIENQEPSVLLRLALVLMAVVLSALTYRYIERLLRHRGVVVTFLLVLVMTLLGLAGWSVYSRDGLEFRYRKIVELPNQMKRDFTKWEDKGMYPEAECTPNFAYPNASICLQSAADAAPSTVVFGDSHAFHAYWGIAKSFADEGRVVKLVGRGGCSFALYRQNEDCIRTFEQQVEWLTTNPAVHHVLIVHRLVVQSSSTPSDLTDYQRRMESTLERLIQAGRQVVYVLPVPELRFNPRLCVSKLPLGRQVGPGQCDFALARETSLQGAERVLVAHWREKFPSLEVFDPADTLCPGQRCRAVMDGNAVWMDDNHVTETGSYLLGEAMRRAIRLK
jgi:peptidoglycan/LPS O-acetylase OafA/YrhL